jgi:histone acetyltransferase (RNA polymerase elongator complex component)
MIKYLEKFKNPVFSKKEDLVIWKSSVTNMLIRIYGKESSQEQQIANIKFRNHMAITTFRDGQAHTSGGGNNLKVCQKVATDMIRNIIEELKEFGIPEIKNEDINDTNGINITLNQQQSQQQIVNFSIFIEALQEELTGKQLKEIQEILDNKEEKPEVKKTKIIDKLKSFGENVASNILAGVLTNPQLWSEIGNKVFQ